MTIKKKTRPHAAHDDGVFEQGITALTILSRLHGHSVAPDEVRKLCKHNVLDVAEMVKCGCKLGLRVRGITIDWTKLSGLRLPALAALRDGKYLLLGQLIEDRVVAADLTSRRPKYMTREELEAVWGGRVIAVVPRKTWKNLVPKFSLPKLPIPKFSALRRVLQFLRPARLSSLGAAVALYPTRLLRGVAGQWLLRERAEDASPLAFERPVEDETPIDPAKTESALLALTILLRCHGIGAEPDQIRHRIGSPRIGVPEMLRCARDMELKARLLSTRWERLASTPLPGIAVLRDGTFLILGKVASDRVLVQRPTEQRPDTMTREEFVVPQVKGFERNPDNSWSYWADREKKIAYIRLTQFTPDIGQQITGICQNLLKEGMKGLVFDLRFNPGGRLEEAVQLIDLFVKKGVIVSVKGRNRPEQVTNAKEEGTLPDFPMAVLVNEHSASASEVMAGSLKDNKRAVVVGARTYGKGSVQEVMPLDANAGELKMTVAYWYLPNGERVQRLKDAKTWGVEPDYVVPMDDQQQAKLIESQIRSESMRVALKTPATTQSASGTTVPTNPPD